jgi:hypothetical protein
MLLVVPARLHGKGTERGYVTALSQVCACADGDGDVQYSDSANSISSVQFCSTDVLHSIHKDS